MRGRDPEVMQFLIATLLEISMKIYIFFGSFRPVTRKWYHQDIFLPITFFYYPKRCSHHLSAPTPPPHIARLSVSLLVGLQELI